MNMGIGFRTTTAQPDGYNITIAIIENCDNLNEVHDLEHCIEDAYTAWLQNGKGKL